MASLLDRDDPSQPPPNLLGIPPPGDDQASALGRLYSRLVGGGQPDPATAAGDWRDTIAPQPSAADAADATAREYRAFQARDRAEQVRLGNVDPETGKLTPQGWQAQAQVIGGGFGPADIGATGLLGTIKAYHGSPHAFEQFSSSKIGTGEGAQAFGHGLYFAENEGVARGYRDKLSAFDLKYGDQPFTTLAHEAGPPDAAESAMGIRDQTRSGIDPAQALKDAIAGHRFVADRWNARTQTNPSAAAVNTRIADRHSNVADWLETLDPSKLQAGKGSMYEVNLAVEPEHMLHWDKPISEQSPQVQKALVDAGLTPRFFKSRPGSDAYQHMVGQVQSEYPGATKGYNPPPGFNAHAIVVKQLADAGIPGISYLDAGSRGQGQGTMNHVIFDDATIEMMRRYGIAGLMAGGAATAFGNQDQNQ